MSDVTPLFHGEVQLCSWSETHNGGAKVVLWLADAADLDAFRALTVRKGNTAGQRFACVLVEISDDELPVQEPPAAPAAPEPEKPQGGALAKLAGMWCSSPDFWRFLSSNGGDCTCAEDAAAIVRDVCKIKSRAELDSNQDAARIFHEQIRVPYMRWQQGAR